MHGTMNIKFTNMPVYVIYAFNSMHTSLLAPHWTRRVYVLLIIWLSEKNLNLLPVFTPSAFCALGKGAVRTERLKPLAW